MGWEADVTVHWKWIRIDPDHLLPLPACLPHGEATRRKAGEVHAYESVWGDILFAYKLTDLGVLLSVDGH